MLGDGIGSAFHDGAALEHILRIKTTKALKRSAQADRQFEIVADMCYYSYVPML